MNLDQARNLKELLKTHFDKTFGLGGSGPDDYKITARGAFSADDQQRISDIATQHLGRPVKANEVHYDNVGRISPR
jgi:hypothetical protein